MVPGAEVPAVSVDVPVPVDRADAHSLEAGVLKRQSGGAERAFRGDPPDDPLALAAAGTMVRLAVPIDRAVAVAGDIRSGHLERDARFGTGGR